MTTKAVTSPAFEALLGDLKLMSKAIDVNQERIAAGRAVEGHMQHGESMAKSEEEKKKEREHAEEEERKKKERERNAGGEHKEGKGEHKEHMAKSFTLKTDDGETLQVVDASDLIKALGGRLDETTASIQETFASVVGVMKAQGELVKSLTAKYEEQTATIAGQDTLIKSLQAEVTKLGSQPAGRRAVVTVAERQASPATEVMAKAGMPEGVTTEDFFAKALNMQSEGKLTGVDIAIAEASLNAGQAVPASIVRRVLGTAPAH